MLTSRRGECHAWDGDISCLDSDSYLRLFAAYYYNRAAEWGLSVVINYKLHAFPEGTAVLDIERGKLDRLHPFFWQTDTSICKRSEEIAEVRLLGYDRPLEWKRDETGLRIKLPEKKPSQYAIAIKIVPRE